MKNYNELKEKLEKEHKSKNKENKKKKRICCKNIKDELHLKSSSSKFVEKKKVFKENIYFMHLYCYGVTIVFNIFHIG